MGKYAKYNKKFNPDWLQETSFKGWLEESKTRCGAFCKLCKAELRAQKNDLKKHAETEVHKRNLARNAVLPLGSQNTLDNLGVKTTRTITNSMKILELKLTIYISMHSAIRGVENLTEFMNENELTQKKINLHRTKCSALIKKVISPSILSSIVEDIGTSPYALIIDESTDVSVNKYMAVLIRFFSKKTLEIKTEYLGMYEVVRATAEQLYESLKTFLQECNLDYKKMIGLGSDGANNMIGEHNSVYARLKNDIPSLELVRCVCHSVHLCSSRAIEELPSNLDYLIRESYKWFSDSSLRKWNYYAIYSLLNDGATPLKLVQPAKTRWLSRYSCVQRILDQWDALKVHFEISSAKEKCFAARMLSEMYKDNINYMYLILLKPILKDLNDTNLLFQSTNANVEVTHDNLKSLLISVASRILTPPNLEYLSKCQWDLEILSKTLNNDLSFATIDNIDFGYGFESKLKKLTDLSPESITVLKTRCFRFLKTLSLELIKRMPPNLKLLQKLKFFTPNIALSQTRPKFIELPFDILQLNDQTYSLIENQWRNLLSVDWTECFPDGKIPSDTVEFWITVFKFENAIKQKCFEELAQCVLNLMSMPVSNAVVERIFSIMNSVKTKTRNRINFAMLDALLRIRAYFLSRNQCCKHFHPTDQMLAKFSSQMYVDLVNSASVDDEFDQASALFTPDAEY